MARVALLSNPRSTGNRSLLPEVRSFCARHQDIFHYEVEDVSQIGSALKTIARVNPKVLVINGGDGSVQAALTEIFNGGHFGDLPPPVAVLPNGKTNLIALDLGGVGDPIAALERVLELARADLAPHIVTRELIAMSDGSPTAKPVIGMFLGGATLADTILYCRHKIYPLGLPNGLAHVLAFFAGLLPILVGRTARFLPPPARPMTVSMLRRSKLQGRFAVVIVTTLERLLLGGHYGNDGGGARHGLLQLLVIERRPSAILRALFDSILGRLGRKRVDGIHIERSAEIRIEGDRSSILLDGELFEAHAGHPLVLKPTAPVSFLRLAI